MNEAAPHGLLKSNKTVGILSATFSRIFKYTLVKLVTLMLTVVVSVFLIVFVVNLGGHADDIVRENIAQSLAFAIGGGWLDGIEEPERTIIFKETQYAMENGAGLYEPFMLRTFRWVKKGLLLDWGSASLGSQYSWATGRLQNETWQVIQNHLARTLLLFGLANLCLFFASVFFALTLTRKFGTLLDRIIVTLSPMSAAPAWVYGVILNILLLRYIGFSTGGTMDIVVTDISLRYVPILFKHMLLPFLAIFLSGLFQSVYGWRAFFLLYSGENYVEMAKAKGLPPRMVERRYLLRPTLPNLITSFALILIALWQEVIALEYFFNIEGIGRLFFTSVVAMRTEMAVSLVVTFAYLLAITVFLLDIVYVIADPRVEINFGSGQKGKSLAAKRKIGTVARINKLFQTQAQLTRPRSFSSIFQQWRDSALIMLESVNRLLRAFRDTLKYPSMIVGLIIILALFGISIYAVISIPYKEVVPLWRGDGNVWANNPKGVPPVWVNVFRKNDLPETLFMDPEAEGVEKRIEVINGEMTEFIYTFTFDYPYGEFPEDLSLFFDAKYDQKRPHITLRWLTPDGRDVKVAVLSSDKDETIRFDQHESITGNRWGYSNIDQLPQVLLFSDPAFEEPKVLKGEYQLQVSAIMFEPDTDFDAEFLLTGKVFGLAGTDRQGRDMMISVLWGTPIALSFGILAAVLTRITMVTIAAFGVWVGGWVDELIQRITEVNMVLPFFPISLMIFTLYSRSFWAILGVTVALSIFGNAIKNYRAIFLQEKEAAYIEAAQSYGVSNLRIVFQYLIPRIIPIMIPQLVILVPSYVFLEATLAFLGMSDPFLPTWGKLIATGLTYGTYGAAHLVLIPISLLVITGFAFAMVGLTLERKLVVS